jgi:hypothetical protein
VVGCAGVATVVAVLVSIILSIVLQVRQPVSPEPDPVLKEAWGPLLSLGANALVCLATPAHLFVRPRAVEMTPGRPRLDGAPLQS